LAKLHGRIISFPNIQTSMLESANNVTENSILKKFQNLNISDRDFRIQSIQICTIQVDIYKLFECRDGKNFRIVTLHHIVIAGPQGKSFNTHFSVEESELNWVARRAPCEYRIMWPDSAGTSRVKAITNLQISLGKFCPDLRCRSRA